MNCSFFGDIEYFDGKFSEVCKHELVAMVNMFVESCLSGLAECSVCLTITVIYRACLKCRL